MSQDGSMKESSAAFGTCSVTPLVGKKLWIPPMTWGGARAFAAVWRSIGVDAEVTPPSTAETLELGGAHCNGDECFPARVTLGDFMRVAQADGSDPRKLAFFMPTAEGPCRFGQYAPFFREVFDESGLEEAVIFAPSSKDGYAGLGESKNELVRSGWRALISADILRKMLLRTRPYEKVAGDADEVYDESLGAVCRVLEIRGMGTSERLQRLVECLTSCRDRYRAVPAEYRRNRLLIGVVGEIFCRLHRFSNENLIRRIEKQGGEAWLADVAEWILYTNFEQKRRLRDDGKTWSMDMFGAFLKNWIQKKDEHTLYEPFKEDFVGYEEPLVEDVLEMGKPYLPFEGALGEMSLSIGKSVYLHGKGVDGILDISPFTCMNGITTEAIYPHLSREHDRLPIRTFYFDGTATDPDRDVGIFLELARSYHRRKKNERRYPKVFGTA